MYCEETQFAADGYKQSVTSLLMLRYLGKPPIAVRGSVTRNLYQFSDLLPVQRVDVRDARFLLASKLFGVVE